MFGKMFETNDEMTNDERVAAYKAKATFAQILPGDEFLSERDGLKYRKIDDMRARHGDELYCFSYNDNVTRI